MMGSPKTEPERDSDETRHRVILTNGFWLADTTCTQQLWLEIMGENPARFSENLNHPVERISWDDCSTFIEKLNAVTKGLYVRFPTEAEWEYACRAGTQTPFSFGETINPDQVNYNGNHPYNKRPKGEYRETTVAVKSLPANPWGLYEMHGNVEEWCADWFDNYKLDSEINPEGPNNGVRRVMRGGSWYFFARRARSAYRSGWLPGGRDVDRGFRFAATGSSNVSTVRQSSIRAAASERGGPD